MSSRPIRRYPLATLGALVLLLAVAAAVLAPNLPLVDPDSVDTPNRLRPPLTDGHLLGTDEFGRDLLSRLVWGARVSLLAGVGTAALAMLVGVQAGYLLGGAVLTETVFAWPGVGTLMVQGILARDFPLVQGCVLVIALSFVVINLAVDLLYAWIDPRIRYE